MRRCFFSSLALAGRRPFPRRCGRRFGRGRAICGRLPLLVVLDAGGDEDAVAPDDRRRMADAGDRRLPADVLLRTPCVGNAGLGGRAVAARPAPARASLPPAPRGGKTKRDDQPPMRLVMRFPLWMACGCSRQDAGRARPTCRRIQSMVHWATAADNGRRTAGCASRIWTWAVPSFPSSAWERTSARASASRPVGGRTRNGVSPTGVPKQSLGTRGNPPLQNREGHPNSETAGKLTGPGAGRHRSDPAGPSSSAGPCSAGFSAAVSSAPCRGRSASLRAWSRQRVSTSRSSSVHRRR